MELPPRWVRTSARWPTTLMRRLQRPLRARRPAALRPGQVVSRRTAAALGALRSTGAPTAYRCGATRTARGRAPSAAIADHDARFLPTLAAQRSSPRPASPPTRTSETTQGRGRAADECRPAGANLDDASERARLARLFAGLDQPSVCAAAASRAQRRGREAAGVIEPWPLRREHAVPGAPATRRWACACRLLRCPMSMPAEYPHLPAGRSRPAIRCPRRERSQRPAPEPAADALPPGRKPRCRAKPASSPRAFRCAPRSPSNRATDVCTSSCRRIARLEDYSHCWSRSRTPPAARLAGA